MPKIDTLLAEMKARNLRLPSYGSGRNGKVLRRDLIKVLESYSLSFIENLSVGLQLRILLDEVMLSYRYDDLNDTTKQALMNDDNGWIAEKKLNGCRLVMCYVPEEGLHFFSRNRSKTDFLPIDYTDKILFCGKLGPEWKGAFGTNIFLQDLEAVTDGFVETGDGRFTNKTLNAAVAVLQLEAEASKRAQRTTAPLKLVAFDHIFVLNGKMHLDHFWSTRRLGLEAVYKDFRSFCKQFGIESNYSITKYYQNGKKAYLEGLLAAGEEGIILKNAKSPYVQSLNNFRDKNACVKVKRSMMNSLGSDIDTFIIGYTLGDEHSKRGWIAGVKLGVHLRGEDCLTKVHWIATVSSLSDEWRETLSDVTPSGEPFLKDGYYDKVVTIDGQDISARNRRISHARCPDGFSIREDKSSEDCVMDDAFIESQMF